MEGGRNEAKKYHYILSAQDLTSISHLNPDQNIVIETKRLRADVTEGQFTTYITTLVKKARQRLYHLEISTTLQKSFYMPQ